MNPILPEFLTRLLEEQYGKETTTQIMRGYQIKRKTTLRVNTLKAKKEEIIENLNQSQIQYEMVEWSKEAIILENVSEKEIKNESIYKEGKIYLQSLSSMLPPIILQPEQGRDILDMAAAPGGKTTQIAALTSNKANITACEKNKIRAERLNYNLEKQGAKAYVMIRDATKIDNFFSFDQILLDAPCSGSGTICFENSKWQEAFTIKLLEKSVATQKALLNKAVHLLKPGKEMVYSTCSILKNENEQVIETVLKEKKAEIIPIQLEEMEKLPLLPTTIKGALCVAPNELYEGFFIAKIRKSGDNKS